MGGGAIVRGIIARRMRDGGYFVRRHGGQKQHIKELLAHQVFGKAEAAGNSGGGLDREMPLAHEEGLGNRNSRAKTFACNSRRSRTP